MYPGGPVRQPFVNFIPPVKDYEFLKKKIVKKPLGPRAEINIYIYEFGGLTPF
jgi:hypothetical protein